MSLSEFTLIEVDNTLQVVNAAVREAIEDVTVVQSSLTRADGVQDYACGVVIVVYLTKPYMGREVQAKQEWVLQNGLELNDVYLEEICGDLKREWYFNCGQYDCLEDTVVELHSFIRLQDPKEMFMDVENLLDVLASFKPHMKASEEHMYSFAGYINHNHPALYNKLSDLPRTYGDLQIALYGEDRDGMPF